MKPRFKIEVIVRRWGCGDGCCSDSWVTFMCFDNETQYVVREVDDDHNRSWGWIFEETKEKMTELLGREPVENEDYYFYKGCIDEDDNEYDDWSDVDSRY